MSSSPKIKPEFKPTKPPKERKEWRDPEGSIIRKVVKQRDRFGKLKDVEQIFARVRYTDNEGKKREKKRLVNSSGEAVTMRRQLKLEIELELNPPPVDETPVEKTFFELIAYFETEFVKKAVIVNDQKIEGYKEDLETIRRHLKYFREFFADVPIKKITFDDVRRYKLNRLNEPIKVEYYEKIPLTETERAALPPKSRRRFRYEKKERTSSRKFSSVHRELSRLRKIFNVALRQGWIIVNPFSQGESLIQPGMETARLRICSFDEEQQLLAQCTAKRKHLRQIITFALDTAMRKGEIFKLVWKDVDFANRRIFVKATNTKTGKSRYVPLTSRAKAALEKIKAVNSLSGNLVFGILTDADRAWDSAVENAKIEGLTFHDLRATAITRMLRAGLQEAEVMKISGHSQYSTFLKYVRQDSTGAALSADKMDAYLEREKND